jgi:hypothetical protein
MVTPEVLQLLIPLWWYKLRYQYTQPCLWHNFTGSLEDMVVGVTWPSILPPGWTVEWDPTSAEEEHEE